MLRPQQKGMVAVKAAAVVAVVAVAGGGAWGGDCPNTRNKWGADGGTSTPDVNKDLADGAKKRNG